VTKHDGRETGGQGKRIIYVYLSKSSEVALDIEHRRRLLLAFPASSSDIIVEIE
jgi:general stress protein 26